MTKQDIINKIVELQRAMLDLREAVSSMDSLSVPGVTTLPVQTGTTTGTAPTPAVVVQSTPRPPSAVTHHAGPFGIMIMDKAISGTPGTVTLPVTGHVLSLPRPQDGEMLMGYSQRISLQLAGERSADAIMGSAGTGGMIQQIGDGGPQYWPEMLDRRYNPRAYMTDTQRAAVDAPQIGPDPWISTPAGVSNVPISGQ